MGTPRPSAPFAPLAARLFEAKKLSAVLTSASGRELLVDVDAASECMAVQLYARGVQAHGQLSCDIQRPTRGSVIATAHGALIAHRANCDMPMTLEVSVCVCWSVDEYAASTVSDIAGSALVFGDGWVETLRAERHHPNSCHDSVRPRRPAAQSVPETRTPMRRGRLPFRQKKRRGPTIDLPLAA